MEDSGSGNLPKYNLKDRVGLKDIAKRCRLHVSTVSRSLNDDIRISVSTRKKVQAVAAQMGYVPDPHLSALAVYRSLNGPKQVQGELAYLIDYPEQQKHPSQNLLFQYAKKRAAELGYVLVPFEIEALQLSPKRLCNIWRQRNIRGVLVGPWSSPGVVLDIDWSPFAVLASSYSTDIHGICRITPDQFENMLLHLDSLRARGYRRIGLHLQKPIDLRSGGKFHAAYLFDQARLPIENPPRILSAINPNVRQLSDWIRSEKLDCVISHSEYLEVIRSGGFDVPGDIGFSLISRSVLDGDNARTAGLNERVDLLGRSAIDFLLSLIYQNHWGLQVNARKLLVVGDFCDGESIRRL